MQNRPKSLTQLPMNKQKTAARRRGRPPTDAEHAVSEERVLNLAFHVFARQGYDGTTLRALAKDLGVSHNLLNVRFGTKIEIWKRAVDAQVARAAPPVYAAFDAPDLDDEGRLRQLIYRLCRWTLDNPDMVGLTNIEGRQSSWRLDHIVDAYLRPMKLQFDALLGRVAAKRPVRPFSTLALMSMLVQGVGFYFASAPTLERVDAVHEISPEHLDAQVRAFADFILAALLPEYRKLG